MASSPALWPTTRRTASAPEARIDPVCVSLVSRIDTLRREGVGDKIEKAAAKRYKMTSADLGKVDQLTKANAEFQMRCSTVARQQHGPDARGTAAAGEEDDFSKLSEPGGTSSSRSSRRLCTARRRAEMALRPLPPIGRDWV